MNHFENFKYFVKELGLELQSWQLDVMKIMFNKKTVYLEGRRQVRKMLNLALEEYYKDQNKIKNAKVVSRSEIL